MSDTEQWQPTKKMYGGIILGLHVRRTIGRGDRTEPPPATGCITYRVRRGNGYYGAVLGKLYQDKYNYFVPSSINNPEGQRARQAFQTAVYFWKNLFQPQVKAYYNKRASKGMRMSGYNLWISEFVKATA